MSGHFCRCTYRRCFSAPARLCSDKPRYAEHIVVCSGPSLVRCDNSDVSTDLANIIGGSSVFVNMCWEKTVGGILISSVVCGVILLILNIM